jgi:hypothetical protein
MKHHEPYELIIRFFFSRKTHIMFVIRDHIDTKPLAPIMDKLQNLINSIVSGRWSKSLMIWMLTICTQDIYEIKKNLQTDRLYRHEHCSSAKQPL